MRWPVSLQNWMAIRRIRRRIKEDKAMTHTPFDFCDKCEDRFPFADLQPIEEDDEVFYLCQHCADKRPDAWRKAKVPKDDYDRMTKSGDDR